MVVENKAGRLQNPGASDMLLPSDEASLKPSQQRPRSPADLVFHLRIMRSL